MNDEGEVELELRVALSTGNYAYDALPPMSLRRLMQNQTHFVLGPLAVDLDHDGHTDLAFGVVKSEPRLSLDCEPPAQWRAIRLALGAGDGTFSESPCQLPVSFGGFIADAALADVDGDGATDIALLSTSGALEILLSDD